MAADFKSMACEIVRSLRGNQSQMALSRALGFSFNQVHRWESGVTLISWSDYIRFARECKVDPTHQLRQTLRYQGDAEDLPRLLLFITSSRDQSTVARLSGISRFSLSRWLNGSSDPKLRDVLRLFSTMTVAFPELLQSLAGDRPLPASENGSGDLQILRDKPWLTALLACLDSPRYRKLETHDGSLLAQSIGIDDEEVEKALADLKTIGAVRKVSGRWEIVDRQLQDAQLTHGDVCSYWTERLDDFYRREISAFGGIRNFMVFTCNEESLIKIRQLYLQFCSRANAIIDADRSDDRKVAFMQYSQIFLDELEGTAKG